MVIRSLIIGEGKTRRTFLTGTFSTLASVAILAGHARGNSGGLYVGCHKNDDGAFTVSGFDEFGHAKFAINLPDRGHSIAFHPNRSKAVVFARRPGNFAVEFDHQKGMATYRFDSATDRHLYGHGVFSHDGRYLYTAENDFAAGQGVIGVRDVNDQYRQIAELPSGGIGPHDVKLTSAGGHLVVANGGIRTHPDRAREKLNIDSMKPNLAFVDIENGTITDRFLLPQKLHKLSIRHLSLGPNGDIAVAMQYEGGKRDEVPMIGVFSGQSIRLFAESAALSRKMRHYTGSIAYDASGDLLAVTSPRGNLVTIWQAKTGSLLAKQNLVDGAGAAPSPKPGEFYLSGQRVLMYQSDVGQATVLANAQKSEGVWDNHLVWSHAPITS